MVGCKEPGAICRRHSLRAWVPDHKTRYSLTPESGNFLHQGVRLICNPQFKITRVISFCSSSKFDFRSLDIIHQPQPIPAVLGHARAGL